MDQRRDLPKATPRTADGTDSTKVNAVTITILHPALSTVRPTVGSKRVSEWWCEGENVLEKLLQGGLPLREGRNCQVLCSLCTRTETCHQAHLLCCMVAITLLTLPSRRLTHGWRCQRLSPHNLSWSQPIQEIAELAFGPEPGGGEDEPGEVGRGEDEGIWLLGMQWLCLWGTGHASLCLSFPSTYCEFTTLAEDGQNCSSLHIKEKYFDVI